MILKKLKKYVSKLLYNWIFLTIYHRKFQRMVPSYFGSNLQENLNMAKNEINYLTKKEISYIIITGGLTEFKGFSLGVESVFGTKASVGKLLVVGARDNKYATCIGMIKYFDEKLKLREHEYSMFTQDEIDIISGVSERKMISSDSILGKVFGIFFDN